MSNMQSSSTKKRKAPNDGNSTKKQKATNDENSLRALQGLSRLSAEDKHCILQNLIRNPSEDAANMVMGKIQVMDKTPVTEAILKSFGSRSYSAIHQLDRLRCSQQFEQVGTVISDLKALIKEARRYSSVGQFSILCRIAGVFSHSVEDSGEVFKGISSCGDGIQYELCQEMLETLDAINCGDIVDVDLHQLENAQSQLDRVHSRLNDYCIDQFEEVIEKLYLKTVFKN